MNKILNILVYYPGYAGHFISQILSINDNAFVPASYYENDDKLGKARFKNIYWKHGSWKEFHQSYYTPQWDAIKEFVYQNKCDTYTTKMHPCDYFKIMELAKDFTPMVSKKNYVIIECNSQYDFIIKDFSRRNGNWPNITIVDRENLKIIAEQFNPYVVQLENIFLGKDTFLQEYLKLCNFLQIIPQIDKSLILYNEWYKARKLDKLNLIGGPTRT